MKLLMVISSLRSGGAERVMTDMANFFAGKSWEVTLATFSGEEIVDFYPLDTRVMRVHLNPSIPEHGLRGKVALNLARTYALRRLIKRTRPGAMLAFIDSTNVISILASRALGINTVVSERTDPEINRTVSPVVRTARNLIYRYADTVVAQTKNAGDWLDANCHVMTVVIPNALRVLPALRLPREKLIVSVGRMDVNKGFDSLILAFANVAPRFPEWNVVILGDGPERRRLADLSAHHGLADRVLMPGYVSDIERWLARAGLVVQASRLEGFPNAILEAMGMGAAVISTDCRSGPSEIVVDGENGRLVPVDDVTALAAAMADLLEDERLRSKLGEAARSVSRTYAQDSVMRKWEAVLARPQGVPRFGT